MDVPEGLFHCCGQNPLTPGLQTLLMSPFPFIQPRALKLKEGPEIWPSTVVGRQRGAGGSLHEVEGVFSGSGLPGVPALIYLLR